VRYLNLRDAGVGDKGVTAILASIRSAPVELVYLDLSGMMYCCCCYIVHTPIHSTTTSYHTTHAGNDISEEVLQAALVPAVRALAFVKLEELYLDDNEIVRPLLYLATPATTVDM
jgi:hypothetical protein